MSEKTAISVASTELIQANTLAIMFTSDWSMDHLAPYIDHVLVRCKSAKVVEVVTGADLYCVRLSIDDYVFLLNFEEYSHSCWLECATEQDVEGLAALAQQLN